MATAARLAAFGALLELERERTTLADLLARDAALERDPRERDFAHELLLGTLRRRGRLDHALGPLCDRPLEGLDPEARAALRLGAYQILFLRVPDRAAVHEAVELARARRPRAAGLVNAVLRRLAREGPRPVPDPASDPLGWLTCEGSLPHWLAERWLLRLGPDRALARARALLDTPPATFRLNPRVPDAAARAAVLDPEPLPVPGALRARAGRAIELQRAGALYLQDLGAQLVAHLAASPARMLDACAAPGGKATLMADLEPDSSVLAAEASPRRLWTLCALVRAWGSPNVHVVAGDARRPPFRPLFDAVLLDAPCSGLGTLGRHPDIRWRARPEDLPRQAARQREMLAALAPLVRCGGKLVYATCSSEPDENEDVVAAFLDSSTEFTAEPPPAWATAFADGGRVRTSPERHGGDAFFAQVLRRR